MRTMALFSIDGSTYKGYVYNGKKTRARQDDISPTVTCTRGIGRENKRHGHGTYRFANGDVYEEKWKEGIRAGRGKAEHQHVGVYERLRE